ncbi:MAG: hypothetical protein QXG18_01375 [Candidatus Pacearchaeota archaeon]
MEKERIILLFIIFMLISFISYILFFKKTQVCENLDCFKKNLLDCKKSSFQKNGSFIYEYKILGKKNQKCVVEVKMLFAGGEPKLKNLVNKKMKCYLPLNYFEFPEKEINLCSGKLKEEIQYYLIKESYEFLSQNLGKP